jgi:serine/threonine protein kinase/Flp pilus assembly protein TadD
MNEAPVKSEESLELLVGQVADEFLRRQRDGERPQVEEYLTRHPQATDVLRPVLASLALLDVSETTSGDSPPDLEPHEAVGTLGDFRILREIGRGGMGVVYEAEQISLARRVALKVLPFASTLDARQLQRFKNEAQAAAGLHHTNIVPVHATGCERGVHFYAMQYIRGHTLAAVIAQLRADNRRTGKGKPQPPTPPSVASSAALTTTGMAHGSPDVDLSPIHQTSPTATTFQAAISTQRSERRPAFFHTIARLGMQAAEALEHAHQLGIVHRDIKPANLLVNEHSNLWITDFGLAHCQSQAGLTMSGDLVGTLRYMSPEQALAKRVAVDHRTDIYSLGATLYELLTLEPVFGGADRQELLRQIAFEEPKPLRRQNKVIPVELETIVLKALEKNPNDRYATAKEVAEDLEHFVKDEPIRASRPSLVRRARKWASRHKGIVTTGATILVLASLLSFGTWVWWAWQKAEVEHAAEAALRKVDLLYKERKFADALAAATHADLMLAGLKSNDLQGRAREWRADLKMVNALEEIHLQQTAVIDGHFDRASADPAYEQAFRDYGIDILRLEPMEAARLISSKHTPTELAAGLDDWSHVCWLTRKPEDTTWKNLRVIARSADPDEWRNQLRDIDLDQNRQALKTFALSVPIKTLHPSTLARLGECLQRELGAKEATDFLRQAQREHPGDFWINSALAHACLRLEPPEPQQAVRFFSIALAVRLQSPGAHLNVGYAVKEAGNIDEAIPYFQRAIELKEDYAEAYYDVGLAFYKQGKLQEAESALQKGLALKPDADAYRDLGLVFYEQRKLQEAESALRKALALKSDAEWYQNLGVVFNEQQKLQDAESALRKALALKPNFGLAHNSLGVTLANQGRLHDAIAQYHKALELLPGDPCPRSNLARALHRLGKFAEAEQACREAIALDRDFVPAYQNLHTTLYRQHKHVEAAAVLRKLIERGHANYETFLDAASTAALAGCGQAKDGARLDSAGQAQHRAEALTWMRKNLEEQIAALEKDPVSVLRRLGAWLRERDFEGVRAHAAVAKLPTDESRQWQKFWQEVVELNERAKLQTVAFAKKNPNNARAHHDLGRVLKDQGDIKGALAAFRQELRLDPTSRAYVELLIDRGANLLRQQKHTEAEPLLRDCLMVQERQQPDGWRTFYVRSMLGEAIMRKGPFDEAERLLLSGYEGLAAREPQMEGGDRKVRTLEALARLPGLYAHWGKKERVEHWRAQVERAERNFVRAWLVLSELVRYQGDSAHALDEQQIPDEASLRPKAGDRANVNGKTLFWRKYHSPERHIDFAAAFGPPVDNTLTYGVCYVYVDSNRNDLVLRVGSDDQAKIYLNCKEIYKHLKPRGLVLDEDEAGPLALRKGMNVLVFKVVNVGGGGPLGSIHFLAKDGSPAEGLRFGLEPE